MSKITLKVNGRTHTVDVEPATPLLYILRNDLGLQGPKFGCGLGQCGACTVIINGAAVRSCIMPASSVKGEITTLEGLASNGKLHPLQQAWIDEQVPQCGFCQNGQIMTAKAMLDKNPHPTDAQIREAMNGTLCRCMSYYRVQTAIKRAAKTLADARPLPERRWWHEHLRQDSETDRRSPRDESPGLPQERGTARGELRRIRRAGSRRRMRRPRRGSGTGPLSRSRFPANRFVDRHS